MGRRCAGASGTPMQRMMRAKQQHRNRPCTACPCINRPAPSTPTLNPDPDPSYAPCPLPLSSCLFPCFPDNRHPTTGEHLSHDEVAAEVGGLLLAAVEPLGHALSWALLLLARHPQAQEQAAAEVEEAARKCEQSSGGGLGMAGIGEREGGQKLLRVLPRPTVQECSLSQLHLLVYSV